LMAAGIGKGSDFFKLLNMTAHERPFSNGTSNRIYPLMWYRILYDISEGFIAIFLLSVMYLN
jgi:hypothetical protein